MNAISLPVENRNGLLFAAGVYLCRNLDLRDRRQLHDLDFQQLKVQAKVAGVGLPEARDLLPRLETRIREAAGPFNAPVCLIRCDCGAAFIGRSQRQRCDVCRDAAAKAAVRRGNKVSAEILGRERAQRRAGRVCVRCGKPVKASRSTRLYCSPSCRVMACRERGESA